MSQPKPNAPRTTLFAAALLGALAVPGAAHAKLEVGEQAPDVLLFEAGTGKGVRLSDRLGGGALTVIVFASPTCQASVALDDDVAVAEEELGTRVRVLRVHASGDEQGALLSTRDTGVESLTDGDRLLANVLGAERVPDVFVLDDAGRLVWKGTLRADLHAAGLIDVVDALSAGRTPELPAPDTTPRVCGIRARR